MNDIAELAGLSKSTVSRSLQGDPRIRVETRERVAALARKHGYAVNANARKLRLSRSNTIAVVIHLPVAASPEWSGPFIFQLLTDVANQLWLRGQDLLLVPPESEQPLAYQSLLASKGADGIIFLGQGANDKWLLDLSRTKAPFVVWGAVEKEPRYCTIGSDNSRGGALVARRFIELGRSRILFVGNRQYLEMAQRAEGLKTELDASGSPYRLEYVEVGDFTFDSALSAVHRHLSDRAGDELPDAIFAASDEFALATLAAVEEADLQVPDDVSVIGYDDLPSASHVRPALTTVRQDTRQAGALLVEKLFQMIDGGRPNSTMIPTELVVRQT
jgi:DNA-binding LacI/PurR family transcriptional regulator